MAERHRDPAHYRRTADMLRQAAGRSRFDLCRQAQLRALAAGFDRLAERVERELLQVGAG